jgi:hypothetical protein
MRVFVTGHHGYTRAMVVPLTHADGCGVGEE